MANVKGEGAQAPYENNAETWSKRVMTWNANDGMALLDDVYKKRGQYEGCVEDIASDLNDFTHASAADVALGANRIGLSEAKALRQDGSRLAHGLETLDKALGRAISRRHTLEDDLAAETVLRQATEILAYDEPDVSAFSQYVRYEQPYLAAAQMDDVADAHGYGNVREQYANIVSLADQVHDRMIRLADDLARTVDAIPSAVDAARRAEAVASAYSQELPHRASVVEMDATAGRPYAIEDAGTQARRVLDGVDRLNDVLVSAGTLSNGHSGRTVIDDALRTAYFGDKDTDRRSADDADLTVASEIDRAADAVRSFALKNDVVTGDAGEAIHRMCGYFERGEHRDLATAYADTDLPAGSGLLLDGPDDSKYKDGPQGDLVATGHDGTESAPEPVPYPNGDWPKPWDPVPGIDEPEPGPGCGGLIGEPGDDGPWPRPGINEPGIDRPRDPVPGTEIYPMPDPIPDFITDEPDAGDSEPSL